MKKTYLKPEIVFESFSLSTNIAGDCEVDTNLPSKNECGLYFTGLGNVFLESVQGCDYPVEVDNGDGEWNKICYHVPSGDNLFAS